jgi:hypothetical protein
LPAEVIELIREHTREGCEFNQKRCELKKFQIKIYKIYKKIKNKKIKIKNKIKHTHVVTMLLLLLLLFIYASFYLRLFGCWKGLRISLELTGTFLRPVRAIL